MTSFFFFFFNLARDQELCGFSPPPPTLFIFFYKSSNLETRLSLFASADCTDSKEPISSSRLEQPHCLLSVDFVTQRLPRDRLQTDSYEAQSSENFFFSKKKKKEPKTLVLSAGTVSRIDMARGKITI